MSSPFKVGIIGGGPAGLLLALCLSRRPGVEITVFEKSGDHRSSATYNPNRSYTIDITGHGLRALRYAQLTERFDSELFKFKGIKVVLPSGAIKNEEYSEPGWTGSRGDICATIQNEILSAVRPVTLLFNTEARVLDLEAGIVAYKSVSANSDEVKHGQDSQDSKDASDSHAGENHQCFDLVVAADGGGSGVRATLVREVPAFQVQSMDLGNHSIMLHFDKDTSELDPSYLYIFSNVPFMSVAGAILGPDQKPMWFCQVGFTGKKDFAGNVQQARKFLSAAPKLFDYASEKAVADFASRPCIPTGKAKACSALHAGRVVLLGDAAAPVPPIGQGVNAALESAMELDKLLNEKVPWEGSLEERRTAVLQAVAEFTLKWKPESDALRNVALGMDLSRWWTFPRQWTALLLGYSGLQSCKRSDLSYQQVYARFRRGERVVMAVMAATAVGFACWWTGKKPW